MLGDLCLPDQSPSLQFSLSAIFETVLCSFTLWFSVGFGQLEPTVGDQRTGGEKVQGVYSPCSFPAELIVKGCVPLSQLCLGGLS